MARERTRRTPKPAEPTGLVASAARIDIGTKNYSAISRSGREWQAEAWAFYDTIPEFRYACDWVGNLLSRALLFPTEESEGRIQRVKSGAPYEYLDQFFGNSDDKAEALRLMGIHFSVAGECYVIGADQGDRTHWQVASSSMVTKRKDKVYVDSTLVESDGEPLVIRMWRPHPHRPLEANAPSRAVLPVLGEIHALTQHVEAQVASRLTSAGVMFLPDEIQFPPPPESEGPPPTNNADTFMRMLHESMKAAISRPGSASARTPIVVTAPGEQIGNAKFMTFWTELDKQAIDLRDEAIRRLALGMDMPPEVLTGMGDMNHWGAWQADESAIKSHTEPLLKIITGSIADGYLRPLLEQDDEYTADVYHVSVGADTSEMRLRPNRSKEALELYDRGELDGQTLRRETGFTDEEKPTEDEIREVFTRKVAGGSTTPEIVEAALRALGLDLEVRSGATETQEARPTPSLRDHPVQELPDTKDAGPSEPLVAAADMLVVRALERAGNRLKTKFRFQANVPALELYRAAPRGANPDDLLVDAWAHTPRVAERYGVDGQWLTSTLDSYCRFLLVMQKEHTYALLEDHLASAALLKEAS